MKPALIVSILLTSLQMLCAQEKLSREEALKYAAVACADTKQLASTPIPTDVDAQQPVAIREGEYGGMVLPQKNLTVESLAQAGKKVVPLGQLWLLKLTPMREGTPVAGEQLKLVTLKHQGEEFTLPQCALGAKRGKDGQLELWVFGKSKEPVLKVPFMSIDAAPTPTPVLDMSAVREGDEGCITLKVLGKYSAKVKVTELKL